MNLKKCVGKCGLEKEENKNNFQWRNDRKKFNNKCKVCMKEYMEKYFEENKDEISENKKEYYQKNKEEMAKYNKKYYKENKEEIDKKNKQWYQENKEEIAKYKKELYQENKEEILESKKEYYEENKNEILENRKEYYEKNKDKIIQYQNEYRKTRRKNDPIFKLMENISSQVRLMLKGKKAGKSTKDIIPWTEEQLIEHIEKLFKKPGNEWMHWDNQGVYNKDTWDHGGKIEDKTTWVWNLDHEKPKSHFNITNHKDPKNDPEFQACWDLSNLRPLSAKQNIKDGNRR